MVWSLVDEQLFVLNNLQEVRFSGRSNKKSCLFLKEID